MPKEAEAAEPSSSIGSYEESTAHQTAPISPDSQPKPQTTIPAQTSTRDPLPEPSSLSGGGRSMGIGLERLGIFNGVATTIARLKMSLEVDVISLRLFDDSHNSMVPLFEFRIPNIQGELHGELSASRLEEASAELHLTLDASNMNSTTGKWEPLIEPWQCEAEWSTAFTPDEEGVSRVLCSAPQPFELNVTHALLVSTMRNARTLAELYHNFVTCDNEESMMASEIDEEKARLERHEEDCMPCAVNNLTEVDVRFRNMTMTAQLLAKPGVLVPFEGGSEDVRTSDDFAQTRINGVLVQAIRSNDVPLANELLSRRANVNSVDSNQISALHVACKFKRTDIALQLLKVIALTCQAPRRYAFARVPASGKLLDAEHLRCCLQAGADLECPTPSNLERPLHLAAKAGDLEIVELLLQLKADPLAATAACNCAHTLAQPFPPVHKVLYIAMQKAMKAQDRRFLSRSLAIAASHGSQEDIVRMFREGVDPNSHDGQFTALQLACRHKHSDTVKLLIQHGAEVNLRGPGSHAVTALYTAGRAGSLTIVRLLLLQKADPTALSEKGEVPAQAAHIYRQKRPGCGTAEARREGEETRELLMKAMLSEAITSGYLRAGLKRRPTYCILLPDRLLRFADQELSASRGHIDLVGALEGVEDHFDYADGSPDGRRDHAFEMILIGRKGDASAGVYMAASLEEHDDWVKKLRERLDVFNDINDGSRGRPEDAASDSVVFDPSAPRLTALSQ
eukprot:2327044-Prymnesium_polylepis.1